MLEIKTTLNAYIYNAVWCDPGLSFSLHDSLIYICVQEGKLYYVGPKKEEKREVVIESERKRQIFLDCHFSDIGHHLGQKKTVHRIQSKYYWLGIIKDVVDWVRTFLCVWCLFFSNLVGMLITVSNFCYHCFR